MSKYRILTDDETKVIHETSEKLGVTITPNELILALDGDKRYIIDVYTMNLCIKGEVILFYRSFNLIEGTITSSSVKITKKGNEITILIRGWSP